MNFNRGAVESILTGNITKWHREHSHQPQPVDSTAVCQVIHKYPPPLPADSKVASFSSFSTLHHKKMLYFCGMLFKYYYQPVGAQSCVVE